MRSGIVQDHFADHLGVYIKISLKVPLKFMSKGNYQYTEFSEAETIGVAEEYILVKVSIKEWCQGDM